MNNTPTDDIYSQQTAVLYDAISTGLSGDVSFYVEDQRAALACIHAHLAEGGRLVFNIFDPSLIYRRTGIDLIQISTYPLANLHTLWHTIIALEFRVGGITLLSPFLCQPTNCRPGASTILILVLDKPSYSIILKSFFRFFQQIGDILPTY